MADNNQTYSNHVRWYPLLHFVIMPLLVLNLIYQAVRLYQEPSWDRGIWVALCLVFILMMLAARLMVLTVQDRLIRLEERLRYRELLSAEMSSAASGLPLRHLIALRFASDAELADAVGRVLDGSLKSPKEIKMAVREWRADTHRA